MDKLYGTKFAFDSLERRVESAVKRLERYGVEKITSLMVGFGSLYENKTEASLGIEHFPYGSATHADGSFQLNGLNILYKVAIRSAGTEFGTLLYNNERDKILMVPKRLRRQALKSLVEELKEAKSYGASVGSISNVAKTMRKVRASLKGGRPEPEIYVYQKISADDTERMRVAMMGPSEDMSIYDVRDSMLSSIADARLEARGIGVRRLEDASIYMSRRKRAGVHIYTTPENFPIKLTKDVTGSSFNHGYGWTELTLYYESKKLRIRADIDWKNFPLLRRLTPDMRRYSLKENFFVHTDLLRRKDKELMDAIKNDPKTKSIVSSVKILQASVAS